VPEKRSQNVQQPNNIVREKADFQLRQFIAASIGEDYARL
jgi:hypothetical protein